MIFQDVQTDRAALTADIWMPIQFTPPPDALPNTLVRFLPDFGNEFHFGWHKWVLLRYNRIVRPFGQGFEEMEGYSV